MIFINPRNPKPLHEQIKESVLEQISLGLMSPGDRLPSVREMAQSMRIAPNTIQRAYRELETGGVINSYPGRGSFITIHSDGIRERRKGELAARFTQLIGEMRNMGVTEDEMQRLLKGGVASHDSDG
ncbi:MAG: GntR family transcriptional regulator [Oscillospiraceae bacterium]|nr:GntR family transcriptional regulator [Oscillospiraceae bacterium]